jgi:hypothetical protein
MTTAYTSLLGLALPVTGELSGTWGDTVNTAITSLLDTAVAGTTSITTDSDITLTTTTGASNQARQAIILWNPASGTTTRYITAPAQSKLYTVINASGGTQSVVIRGAGPTTGVTIAKGESAMVAWNGSDFVKVSSSGGAITFTDLTVTGNTILGDAAADTLTVNATSTFASPVNFQGQVKLPSTGRSAAAALTTTNPAFLYGVASTYTDTTSSGTVAFAPFYGLAQPTLSTSNVTTYTNAATLYIANAPTTGGSATITNPYALYVASGANYLGGALTVGGTTTLNGNVTLGDAAADTLTVNSTITSNLIFTDNTYDIGASGATRPRTGYFGTSMFIGNNVAASTQFEVYGTTATYSSSQVLFYDTSSSTGGPSNGLTLKREGGSIGFFSPALTFDVGGGGGRAKIYTSRTNASGGKLYFATDDTTGASYQRYYIDETGTHRWLNVGAVAGTVTMALDNNGLYALDSLGVGANPSSTYKVAVTASNQVGLLISGNTSSHQKQDLYITRASAGSTIQSGPNITIANSSTNGAYALQVMSDSSLQLWSYLSGGWRATTYWTSYGMGLYGNTSNAETPLYIVAPNSSGVGIGIDGGGINTKPSLIQFQQQNYGYWRIGMPQGANRMAIFGYVSATYPELFTFLEGAGNTGTLGIGTNTSTSGTYAIDINAYSTLAINMSRSGGTGIRLNDTATNSWDIYNVSNQLQFVRGGTLGWYMDGGRGFIRKATGDGTFLQVLSSYTGNPDIINIGQTASDGYISIKSAAGDTMYLTGYSAGVSYTRSKFAFATSSTTVPYGRVYIEEAAGSTVALYTSSNQDNYAWRMTGGGGSGAGVRWADVDIGGQGFGGSFIEWTRGGSYDNYLYFNIRASGNTTARRFEFSHTGDANKSSGAGSWGALSDARLKKNFAPVTGGLARIMQLLPKEYDFIVPSAHANRTHERGFVAQDFELVYPSSVTTSSLVHKDEEHLIPEGEKCRALSFNSEFYADLVDAIQTLKNEFDAYKASHP